MFWCEHSYVAYSITYVGCSTLRRKSAFLCRKKLLCLIVSIVSLRTSVVLWAPMDSLAISSASSNHFQKTMEGKTMEGMLIKFRPKVTYGLPHKQSASRGATKKIIKIFESVVQILNRLIHIAVQFRTAQSALHEGNSPVIAFFLKL